MLEPFQLPYVQRGLLEIVLLSAGAGLVGTWIVLRGLAFFSHAAGTATFPGLVLAEGLGFAAPIGAMAAALLYAVSLGGLTRPRRSDYDSLTALSLAGALALGVILASDVFHTGSSVETLLFGSLLLIEPRDVALAAAASAVAIVASLALGRAWIAGGFDAAGARALGLNTKLHDSLLLLLIALVVVSMLSALGALLATSLLVIPAATTRLWFNRIGAWQLATIALVCVEGVAGLWLSVQTDAPPGATIAVLAGGVFAVSAATQLLLRRSPRAVAIAASLLLTLPLVAGCGGSSGDSNGKLDVVATTTQIGDWARQVGGDRANVTQLLEPNTDPHDYEPRPSDVEAVANARVVFKNGDGLDGWIDKVVEQSGGHPQVVDLSSGVPSRSPGESSGSETSRYDPHWWHDPRNAAAAIEQIRETLDSVAPEAHNTFNSNARAYLAKLRRLDRDIEACIDQVPSRQRKLVTDHDAFGYFADRYGIEVIGAVIPSQTTQAQASAGEVAKLSDTIEQERVKAIFPESSLNTKLADSIAEQTGAMSNLTLYGDTLGPKGSDGATYTGMEASNAQSMVEGFSGRRQTCTIANR
jgi:ABC-type Zn uptake system ZnuABC Zn-binding protein ZnuA